MLRHSQLKSVPIVFDDSKSVTIYSKLREGIFKGNHDFLGVVSLKRTLSTFFREKVGARRAGDIIMIFIKQGSIAFRNRPFSNYSKLTVLLRRSFLQLH